MLFSKKGKKKQKSTWQQFSVHTIKHTHLIYFPKHIFLVPFPEDKNYELIPISKKTKNYVSIKNI